MKNLVLLLLFAVGFANAQNLIEDNDISENSKELGKSAISFNLKNPTEFYRLKCTNATYAQFPGGEEAFKKELFKNIEGAVNNGNYSVNGTFDLVLFIDKTGSLQNFILKPKVSNSNLLENDLKNAIKKMNKKWTPATCNGISVDSKLQQKVNFNTENFDV